MKNVIFCYPSKKIGGAQLLFIRCADYLSKHAEFNIYYIDYIDGFARKELENSNVEFINYEVGKKNLLIEHSFLIVPLSYINIINDNFVLTNRNFFLFWSISPYNIVCKIKFKNYFIISKATRKKIGNIINELSQIGVIRFMDYSNYISASKAFLFTCNNIKYLPIPIEDNNLNDIINIEEKEISKSKITFLWLSRLDSDKANTLVTFMNEIESLSSDYSLVLYVAGNGNELEYLKQISSKYTYDINFLGKIYGKELDLFIDENIDIGIAMGTSALEIAKRGKPVIVKGLLNKVFDSNQLKDYIFLHEEYGFSLGSPDFYYEGQNTFNNKVNQIIQDYKLISENCYNYVFKYHTLTNVGNELIDTINQISNLNSEDIISKLHLSSNYFNPFYIRTMYKKITSLLK